MARVDPRDPPAGEEHLRDDLSHQRRLSHRQGSTDFRDASAGNPPTQGTVERSNTRDPRSAGRAPPRHDCLKLIAERCEVDGGSRSGAHTE